MGSVTIFSNADVAIQTNNNYGAGTGPHLPVGYWSSTTYRAGIRFTAPAWNGWTKITKATLHFWISDHAHVGVRNSTILIRRQPTDDMWTRGEGTYSCNSGFSSGNTTNLASDLTSTSTDGVSFASGTTANAKKSVVVTAMVQAYFAARTAQPVFIFQQNSTSDYTELWSRTAGSTYDPYLVIEYEDDTVPNAPTLGYPADGAIVPEQNPTFSWTHNDPQGNPQVSAEVHVPGLFTNTVVGAGNAYYCPTALDRGGSYQYMVRTADALGYGPWSALRTFHIAGYVAPVVVANYLIWTNGAIRYITNWTWSSPDSRYATHHRIVYWSPQNGSYDSGWLAGNPGYHVASSMAVSENSQITELHVQIRDSFGIESEVIQPTWTARYGTVVHRIDLGSIPTSWGTPTIQATIPTDSTLVIQYGSNSTPEISPTAWYESLSSVPKNQYLYYALNFLPNYSDQAPTLHQITIPVSNTVETLDHWKKWQGLAFGPPWSLDPGEYVYGTRSVREDPSTILDAWNPGLHSELMQLRAGRSYVLSGLMRSEGNSGAYIQLLSEAGSGLAQTQPIRETRDWFKADNLDTYRYRTPVYVSPSDQKVYAYLKTSPQPSVSSHLDPDVGTPNSAWVHSGGLPVWQEGGAGGIPLAGWGSFFVCDMEPAQFCAAFTDPAYQIAVTPGKRYRMRGLMYGYYKTFQFNAWWMSAPQTWQATAGGVTVPSDSVWRWYDVDLGIAPAGAMALSIAIENGTSGGLCAFDEMTLYEDYSVTAWFDAIKLEESTVATPWSPGAVGASAVDAGGVQIDGAKGAVLRYRGQGGGLRDLVEGGAHALLFGSDTQLYSDTAGRLKVEASNDARTINSYLSRLGYVHNGDFELGTKEGWFSTATAWYVENLQGTDGWKAQKWQGRYVTSMYTDNGDGNNFLQHADHIPVQAGQLVTVSAIMGCISGNNLEVQFIAIQRNRDGQEFTYIFSTHNVTASAERYSATWTMSADVFFLSFRIAPKLAGVWVVIDDVHIERG
jgi:hypothetical protein